MQVLLQREARVALDAGGVVALAVPRGSLSSKCHSQSHGAKGPEIEPRHRLVPAVGIMRLVAGQARLLRQWSFACIGGTNVCLCV